MRFKLLALASVSGLLALSTACKPPKIMIAHDFVPGMDKVARYSVKPVGSVGSGSDSTDLSNYYIQVCDVRGTSATNCKTTLVLTNITNFVFVGPRLPL